jgi:hypothetical protein
VSGGLQHLPPADLGDNELEAELTIAASARDHLRMDRYEELLAEAERRGLVRGDGEEPG